MYLVLNRLFCSAAIAVVAISGCTDEESATSLHPEGPPMIQQVRLKEVYFTSPPPPQVPVQTDHRVFAYGSNAYAVATDYSVNGEGMEVTTAGATGQYFRIVMDELLVGNYLEEIACNAQVDDDVYQPVPVGTTPDDIANCSVASDLLPVRCPGANTHSVCICQKDAGCTINATATSPAVTIPKGESVGILDANQDGSVDDTRMINGAVGVRCGSTEVPIDLDASYWNPSGTQQKPAEGGFEAIGPAIVLYPARPLPTNLECGLAFSTDIVDKEDNRVCAPAGGDITTDCTPGDVSAFKFRVEALAVVSIINSFGDDVKEGSTGVTRADPFTISLNVPYDVTTIQSVTIVETTTGTPFTGFTITPGMSGPNGPQSIKLTFAGAGLAANTMYTLTVATTLKDTYGQPLPAAYVVHFTTGA